MYPMVNFPAFKMSLKSSDPTASAETLSAQFGRKSPQRTGQIEGILETLRDLGQI